MTSDSILYLSREDVESVGLDMRTIIDLLEQAFKEKGQGKVEMPPKPGIHTMPDAFIHAMPAYIPSMKSAGIKWVSGYPENFKRGLPYISGLLILNDVETGIPYAIMDCTLDHRLPHRRGLGRWRPSTWRARRARRSASWPAACRDAPTWRRCPASSRSRRSMPLMSCPKSRRTSSRT